MKNAIPFHYCPHFVLCKDELQGESFPKQASLQNPRKKTPILTTNVYHLNLTSSHKLENKIQPW